HPEDREYSCFSSRRSEICYGIDGSNSSGVRCSCLCYLGKAVRVQLDGRDGALRRPRPRSSGNEYPSDTWQSKELRRCTRRGHRSAMSLPFLLSAASSPYPRTTEIPRRKPLPHEIPSWVDPQKEIYFISINCEERFRNQLALPGVSQRLFETVRHRQEKFLWWPYLFLLMPDHLHALLSFPASGKSLKLVVSKWKEWTAKVLGIVWQRDFFEHRLRHDESRSEKAVYSLENPVRKK